MAIEIEPSPFRDFSVKFTPDGQCLFNGLPVGSITVSSNNFSIVQGTTSGYFSYSEYEVLGVKIFIARFDGYSNTTSTAQTVTFPIAFTNTPFLLNASASLTEVRESNGSISVGYASSGGQGGGVMTLVAGELISSGGNFPVSGTTGITASTTVLTIPASTTNVGSGVMVAIGN
jgi:hypothetical protein